VLTWRGAWTNSHAVAWTARCVSRYIGSSRCTTIRDSIPGCLAPAQQHRDRKPPPPRQMNESKTPDPIKYRFTTIFKIVIFQGNLNPPMFISNSKKFIYIHLYKCAGTTIEIALSRSLKWNDILIAARKTARRFKNIYLKLFGLHKHSTAQEVKDVIGDASWKASLNSVPCEIPIP